MPCGVSLFNLKDTEFKPTIEEAHEHLPPLIKHLKKHNIHHWDIALGNIIITKSKKWHIIDLSGVSIDNLDDKPFIERPDEPSYRGSECPLILSELYDGLMWFYGEKDADKLMKHVILSLTD